MTSRHRSFHESATSAFLIATTVIAVVFSFAWYMSPLAFIDWPSEPGRRELARTIYAASYKIGIPGLLIAQVFAIVMGARGYRRAALVGDGSRGWPEHAPFDKILVTVSAERTPPALLEQLKSGGRLVLPLGPEQAQSLTVIDKDAAGQLNARKLIPVRLSRLETV